MNRFELLPQAGWLTRVRDVQYDHSDLSDDRRRTAYHEAGHSIFGMAMNHSGMVAEVYDEAVQDPEHGLVMGIVKPLEESDRPPMIERKEPERPCSEVTIGRAIALGKAAHYLAGHQAEYIYLNLPPEPCIRLRNDPDSTNAKQVVYESFGNATGPLYFAQRLARTILTRHWEELETLAEEIHEQGAVSLDPWKKKRGGFIRPLWPIMADHYGIVG